MCKFVLIAFKIRLRWVIIALTCPTLIYIHGCVLVEGGTHLLRKHHVSVPEALHCCGGWEDRSRNLGTVGGGHWGSEPPRRPASPPPGLQEGPSAALLLYPVSGTAFQMWNNHLTLHTKWPVDACYDEPLCPESGGNGTGTDLII